MIEVRHESTLCQDWLIFEGMRSLSLVQQDIAAIKEVRTISIFTLVQIPIAAKYNLNRLSIPAKSDFTDKPQVHTFTLRRHLQ